MLNNGGAVQTLEFDEDKNVAEVGVRGAGEMRVFSSEIPKACKIDNEDVDFEYEDGMLPLRRCIEECSLRYLRPTDTPSLETAT
ncbi:hypothetical protein PIB30_017701 [Stylosanthes scabra]|uniref:Uncharacterized protein n=1 Tax=Stylosanthes scabra TaxID=79078 RepID=A0ABU6Q7I3_9FABA|nr:hypothetical protein [Stylosanthes scabra]